MRKLIIRVLQIVPLQVVLVFEPTNYVSDIQNAATKNVSNFTSD